ncbi:MAG: ferredoxin [Pseudomonadota bacterium]
MAGLAEIQAVLAPYGLTATGAFHPGPMDGAPGSTGTLCLIGADGVRMWPVFHAAPEPWDGQPHPLDRWSKKVLSAVAEPLGATALFPFGGPPWHPFLRWAERAEGARASPIGPSVTATRGLWASWRGALALQQRIALPAPDLSDPCATCAAPCVSSCPVGALGTGPYDVPRCTAHVLGPDGSDCRGGGCLARRACPAGQDATPPYPQRQFHMAAFLTANAGPIAGGSLTDSD